MGCHTGNTDEDPEYEVIFSLTAGEPNEPLFTSLVVFERTDGGFDVSYQFSRQAGSVPVAFLDARDVNGDGVGDLAFAEITCGAHTCTWHVHVVSGEDGTYRELTPAEGLSLETADIRIDETDGDGSEEIIMHGGIIESVGAGPQRARTDTYAWDGATYALRSSTKEPSDARLFRVQDADTSFAAGDYGEAATLYDQAVNDSSLQDVDGFGSREELMAYALFRLGLSRLQLGNTAAASDAIERAISQYAVSLHSKAAVEFRNASRLTQVAVGDISAGCAAATASLSGEPDRFREVWNYGYANPGPALEDVCPF